MAAVRQAIGAGCSAGGGIPIGPLLAVIIDYASPFIGRVTSIQFGGNSNLTGLCVAATGADGGGGGGGGGERKEGAHFGCTYTNGVSVIVADASCGIRQINYCIRELVQSTLSFTAICPHPLCRGTYYAVNRSALYRADENGSLTKLSTGCGDAKSQRSWEW